jgi:hypothetical protein
VKRLAVILGLLILLMIGGGLTTQLIARQDTGIVPVLRQTDNPEAEISAMQPWKAEQFFLVVGFILFNLVGMAVTIAIIVWLIDRGLRRSRAQAGLAPTGTTASAPRAPADAG